MNTQQLTYEQFKADILQWKNTHREEYGRFVRLMADGDEAQYLAICIAVFTQMRGIKREWELSWNDDSIENFENIFLRFNEGSVPGQIVDMYREQREEKDPDPAPASTWDRHFAMDKAIKSGEIGEWALQSVTNDLTKDNGQESIDQQKGLAGHLNCDNKEAVIGAVWKFLSKYGTAAEQVLTYYALSELGLLTGIDTAKDFATALVAQYEGLGGMKSESSYRQAIHTLTTEQYVMKDGKYTKCVMLEGDACRTMLAELKAGITEAMNGSSSKATDNPPEFG